FLHYSCWHLCWLYQTLPLVRSGFGTACKPRALHPETFISPERQNGLRLLRAAKTCLRSWRQSAHTVVSARGSKVIDRRNDGAIASIARWLPKVWRKFRPLGAALGGISHSQTWQSPDEERDQLPRSKAALRLLRGLFGSSRNRIGRVIDCRSVTDRRRANNFALSELCQALLRQILDFRFTEKHDCLCVRSDSLSPCSR